MAVNPIKLPKKPKKPREPGPEPLQFIAKRCIREISSYVEESLQSIIDQLPEGIDFAQVNIGLASHDYDESHIEISWPEPTLTPNPSYGSQIDAWRRASEKYRVEMLDYEEKMVVFQKALNERNAVENAAKIRELEKQLAHLKGLIPPA